MRSNREAWEAIAQGHESTLPLDFAPLLRSLAPEGSVLEIGCGYGRVMRYLSEAGCRSCIGVDASRTMIGRARHDGVSGAIVASAERLPFSSGSFAAVVAVGAFSSLVEGERRGAICEAARVLAGGGALFLRDFGLTLHGWRLARYIWQYPRFFAFGDFRSAEGIHFHHFRMSEVRRLASVAGLELVFESRHTFTTMHGRPANGFTILARKGS